MKKFAALLAICLCALSFGSTGKSSKAFLQTPVIGQLTSTATDFYVTIPANVGTVSISTSGTWSQTIVLKTSNDNGASYNAWNVPILNTNTLDVLGITSGTDSQWVGFVAGTNLDFHQTAFVSGVVTISVRFGPGPSPLAPANASPLPTGAATAANQTNGNQTVQTVAQGTSEEAPPASVATGTDWVTASTPALSGAIKYIWVDIAPGTTCSIKYTCTSGTFTRNNVQSGYLQMTPGLVITKIFAAANGSTGLVIDVVGY